MKRNFLKRSMALVLSITIAVSALPTGFALAEESVIVTEESTDGSVDEILDEAEVAELQAEMPQEYGEEGAEAADTIQIEEIEMIDEAEALLMDKDPVADNVGSKDTPPQVTNLTLKNDGEEVAYPSLVWDYVPKADHYEFSVVDTAGRAYYENAKKNADNTITYTYYSYKEDWSDALMPEIALYKINPTTYKPGTDEPVTFIKDGYTLNLTAMQPGQTYTIKVRAVNRFSPAGTADYTDYPGAWSAEIKYTVPGVLNQKAAAIADLKFVKYDAKEEKYFFTYGDNYNNERIHYQYSPDPTFGTLNTQWGGVDPSETEKLAINAGALIAGTTYYIRAYYGAQPTLAEQAALKANVVTFKTEVASKKTPKQIKKLELAKETADTYEFRFEPVIDAEDGDFFHLEYSDDITSLTWNSRGEHLILDKDDLDHYGAWFVRIAAYNESYRNSYGIPQPIYSNVVTINKKADASSISNLALKEGGYGNNYLFSYKGSLNEYEDIEWWISDQANFTNASKYTTYGTDGGENGEIKIYYDRFAVGKTYYVRARVRNYASANEDDYMAEHFAYSAFTNTVKVTTTIPRAYISANVDSANITLKMNYDQEDFMGTNPWLTGYEIQKKNGSKFYTLKRTTSAVYTDKNLKKNKTYTYRVRAYYQDKTTGTYSYGPWEYTEQMTWGAALKLKAAAISKTSVKLSWSKVSGATGYEVYRRVANSYGDEIENGYGNSFDKWTLVKTIKKSSTKSYTIKKLTEGAAYSFMVRAYRKVGKKTYYINETEYVNLGFSDIYIQNVVEQKNGTVKASWQQQYAADGYVIEKQNEDSEEFTQVAKLPAATTTYTFPAATERVENYRIRAYVGTEYSRGAEIEVYPYLAAPTGVTAVANQTDGSIKISWNAVSGAEYYEVYRSASPSYVNNKDLSVYYYVSGNEIPVYTPDVSMKTGYVKVAEKIKGTSVTDRKVSRADGNGMKNMVEYEGPKAGVNYYYYVVAYKESAPKYNTVSGEYTIYSGRSAAANAMISNTSIAKPSIKKVSVGKEKATITWKSVSGAERYDVYYSEKKSSGYQFGASSTTTKVTVAGLTKGKKYYFKVVAVKANEAGADTSSAMSAAKRSKKVK